MLTRLRPRASGRSLLRARRVCEIPRDTICVSRSCEEETVPRDTRKSKKTSPSARKSGQLPTPPTQSPAPQPIQREAPDTTTQATVSALITELPTLSQQLRQSSDRQAAEHAIALLERQPEHVLWVY